LDFWWLLHQASHEQTLKEESPYLFQVEKEYGDMQYGPQLDGKSSTNFKERKLSLSTRL